MPLLETGLVILFNNMYTVYFYFQYVQSHSWKHLSSTLLILTIHFSRRFATCWFKSSNIEAHDSTHHFLFVSLLLFTIWFWVIFSWMLSFWLLEGIYVLSSVVSHHALCCNIFTASFMMESTHLKSNKYLSNLTFFAYTWQNKSFFYRQNTHFIFYDPYPFCAYFERYKLSP